MDINSIINSHYDTIANAIYNHHKKYMLSSCSYDLCMYVDEAGQITLKSEGGSNTNKLFEDDHYVIYKTGGCNLPVWNIIGDVFKLLEYDDMLHILDDIPSKSPSKPDVEKYVEENYPQLIEEWLEEYHDHYYDDEIESAYAILEEFLDGIGDIDFDNEEDE